MERHLSIPYYSQWKDTADSYWKERSCAIAAMKMAVDSCGISTPSIDQLISQGVAEGGHDPRAGWKHNALKALALRYGVLLDLREYKGKEGIDVAKALLDIEESIIKEKCPVLVSLAQQSGSSHLVIATGIKVEKDGISGLYINDPDDSENGVGEGYFMGVEEFKDRFRGLTLFSLGKLAK